MQLDRHDVRPPIQGDRSVRDDLLALLVAETRDYGILTLDTDGIVTSWNAGATAVKGFAAAEIIGRSFRSFYPAPDQAARKPERHLALAAAHGRFEDHGWRMRADGSCFWAHVVLTALRGPNGDLRGYGKVTRDLTAEHAAGARRRLADADLRRAEALFRTAVAQAPNGIALVALDGTLLRVNRALCAMTGYAEDDLLASTLATITHPDDAGADVEHSAQLLAGQRETYEVEKRCFRQDGSAIWVLLSVALVRDDDGEPGHFVVHLQDITDRKRHERDLQELAQCDPLTGLANRREFRASLTRQLAHQARHGGSHALVMLDLDHFKYVNDTFGHRVGDQLIRAVADALVTRLRTTDTIGRLGGDEFAVLLPETDHATADMLGGELVSLIAGLEVDSGEHVLQVSASIGIAVAGPQDGYDEETLTAAADAAMYAAKEAGRGRHAIYDADAARGAAVEPRLGWSERLRGALDAKGFVLHYQPIVDLRDGSSTRYEALIRLPDESGELISPGVFLYIAERYGLMPEIDRWVAHAAIADLASGALPAGSVVALNVSARSLVDGALVEVVQERLEATGVLASQLVFELEESTAIAHLEMAVRFGRALHRLGCGLALDGFGAGFGSFFHLKALAYDTVKIDGDLVEAMASSPADRLLVEALVTVARGMGKVTVAGYVGDESTAAILRTLGVDYAQGFHLGRPAPVDGRSRGT